MDALERRQQIEALVIMLIEGYPSLINAGEGTVAAYVRPLMTLDPQAVRNAVDAYQTGVAANQRVGRAPDATEFYLEAQRQHALLTPRDKLRTSRPVPEGYKLTPDGRHLIVPPGKPIPEGWDRIVDGNTIDFGAGTIQLGGLTHREAQVIQTLGGMSPDGKNFALLSLDEKRAEIGRYLAAPETVAA